MCLAFAVRVYKLIDIPGEMWGDIIVGYEFTREILTGQWPFYFVLGNGPLFFYLVAAIALVGGLSFTTMKITSVMVGLVLVIGSYAFAKELTKNRWVGLITAFLIAVSRWPVTFSRLGNMNILVPVFIVWIFYFMLKAYNKPTLRLFVAIGLLTGLGLYNYPAFLFVPISIGVIFIYGCIRKRMYIQKNSKKILAAFIIFGVFASFFVQGSGQFGFTNSTSYFGSKLFERNGKLPPDIVARITVNIINNLSMFHLRGDEVFRVNMVRAPHLDLISGIFLLFGIYFLIRVKPLRAYALFICVPFLILQLPSILVVNFMREVPSATRNIGILPFLYTLIAIGIWYVGKWLYPVSKNITFLGGIVIFFIISYRNMSDYFIVYANGLPNRNTPFGKIIAERIDRISPDKKIAVVGCCWGSWGQPEPGGIKYVLTKSRTIDFIPEFVCNQSTVSYDYYVISPLVDEALQKLYQCYPEGVGERLLRNGYEVGRLFETRRAKYILFPNQTSIK